MPKLTKKRQVVKEFDRAALAATATRELSALVPARANITQSTPEKRLSAKLQETISVHDSPNSVNTPDKLAGSNHVEAILVTCNSPSSLAPPIYKGTSYDWRENKTEKVIVLSKVAKEMQSRI